MLGKKSLALPVLLIGILLISCACPVAAQHKKTADSKSPHTMVEASKTEAQIDLNTASRKELESLPGIGGASAKKIIAGRPYAYVSDLSKAALPAKTVKKITPLVRVSGGAPAFAPPSSGKEETSPPAAAKSSSANENASDTDKSSDKAKKSRSKGDKIAQTPPQKGMVWVNLDSGIYHKEGARWFGKTKNGKFMNEADAIKAGYRSAKN